jgi:homoserine dehydrogenase
MEKPLNIGMIGFGNIGAGVVRALDRNKELISARVPHPIRIARITDVDTTTVRNAPYDPAILSSDTDALLADPDIHVVLELTGKIDIAYNFIDRALKAGKHVVTANKALMATRGMDLIKTAVQNKRCLLFEAAVAGGIPLIRTLHQGMAANDITAVRGIINGTSNYILTCMEEKGLDFQTALAQAQELGYAEPDPTYDVEGHDTAHKLAILATLSFGQDIRFEDVYREGITGITKLDIDFSREMGYRIKLLGISKQHPDGSVEARVHPTLLPIHSRLASVGDVFNAVRIDGNLTGSVILSGKGAGPDPTSSAILSDMMALASGMAEGGLQREMRLCMPKAEKNLRPVETIETRYLYRFHMMDEPGALAQVLAILGGHGVSIQAMKQPSAFAQDKCAHVFALTHRAREAQIRAATVKINNLPVIRSASVFYRIEDMG